MPQSVEQDHVYRLYQRHAAEFDRDRGRWGIEHPWLARVLALAPSSPVILDLGCGMAEPIAAYLICHGAKVTGVDATPALLDLARARFPSAEWIEADMRQLALNRRFDAIIAWDSVFHLKREDQRQMFPIFAAHARPGAPLLFTSGPGDGEAIGDWYGEKLFHASLSPAEYRSLLAANGFDEITFAPEDPATDRHSVWLARRQQ
jgi:cyclopropane fatty-acyl-phospholipid synthase-like methyltransferase